MPIPASPLTTTTAAPEVLVDFVMRRRLRAIVLLFKVSIVLINLLLLLLGQALALARDAGIIGLGPGRRVLGARQRLAPSGASPDAALGQRVRDLSSGGFPGAGPAGLGARFFGFGRR